MNTEAQNVEMQGTDPFIFILLTPLSFTETQNVDMQGTDPFIVSTWRENFARNIRGPSII